MQTKSIWLHTFPDGHVYFDMTDMYETDYLQHIAKVMREGISDNARLNILYAKHHFCNSECIAKEVDNRYARHIYDSILIAAVGTGRLVNYIRELSQRTIDTLHLHAFISEHKNDEIAKLPLPTYTGWQSSKERSAVNKLIKSNTAAEEQTETASKHKSVVSRSMTKVYAGGKIFNTAKECAKAFGYKSANNVYVNIHIKDDWYYIDELGNKIEKAPLKRHKQK